MIHINLVKITRLSRFGEEAENIQVLKHDDRQKRIAKGHLSHSGDLIKS